MHLIGGARRVSTWKKATPSTVTMALSRVITSCEGTGMTRSIMLMLVADAVDERHDQAKARLQRVHIFAEALDRVVVALRHHADGAQEVEDHHRKTG
jgi:hypothetical protein